MGKRNSVLHDYELLEQPDYQFLSATSLGAETRAHVRMQSQVHPDLGRPRTPFQQDEATLVIHERTHEGDDDQDQMKVQCQPQETHSLSNQNQKMEVGKKKKRKKDPPGSSSTTTSGPAVLLKQRSSIYAKSKITVEGATGIEKE